MLWQETQMALRMLPYLDAHADVPGQRLCVRTHPTEKHLVWCPETVDWVFRSDQRVRHPGSRSMIPFLGKRSLLWSEGERHAGFRRELGAALRTKAVLGYRDTVARIIQEGLREWSPGAVLTLPAWTRRVALRIIGRIVLGHEDSSVLTGIERWLDDALGARRRTLTYRYLRGGLPPSGARLDQQLVSSARRGAEMNESCLAAVLLAGDSSVRPEDDGELRDHMTSLLFAGHETTAAGAAFAVHTLEQHPRVLRDVRDELAATPDDGADARQVPFLQAVVQETLRLKPPVPAASNRQLVADTDVAGDPFTAGTDLSPSIYLAHRNPEVYANPTRFDPYRFLDRTRPPRHAYLPFGGGTRMCLGSQLAEMEIRMIVAAVARGKEWRCQTPRAGSPRLRVHTVAPSPRLRVRVTACRE